MRATLDRIAAIVVKEFRHLGRDPRALLAVAHPDDRRALFG